MSAQKNLSKEQLKFCELYAGGMSSTAAYMEAYGTTDKEQARCNSSRLMKKPQVREMALKMQKDVYDRLCLNAEKVAIKLAEMAFADKEDEIYGATVQLKALDMLQKQLGLQKQQIKQEVEQKQIIRVTIDEEE